MNSTTLVLVVGYIAYLALGVVALRFWQRQTGHLPTLNVNPDTWLPWLLPQLIAVEAWVFIGAGVLGFLLTRTTPVFEYPVDAPTVIFGFVGVAAVFAMLDAVIVVRTRQVARRQAAAHQDDPA
jgi:nitric oxide reductase large subunit